MASKSSKRLLFPLPALKILRDGSSASLKLVYEVHVELFLPTHEDQHFGQLRMLFDQLVQHRLVLHQQPSVGL